MPIVVKSKRFWLRLQPQLYEKLKEIAQEKGMNVSELVRYLILNFVEDYEKMKNKTNNS